jgi:hypothetical protein
MTLSEKELKKEIAFIDNIIKKTLEIEEHKHKLKTFVERGCTDNKFYHVCECGYYEECEGNING